MQLSVALLLLQLVGNTIVFAQSDCSTLPDVKNAKLSDDSPKSGFQKGVTISFTCDTGYTSGRHIRYVCTNEGWISEHQGTCRLKPCILPDDIANGYYQVISGDDFVFGTRIKYFCNEGYQMASKEDTRTCLVNEWSNHVPVCEPLSCDTPPTAPGLIVDGLPDEESTILPNRVLTFTCNTPGSKLNGSSTLICGSDGKWDNPFPNCIVITCKLPAPNPRLHIVGAEGGSVTAGHWVTVQCVSGGSSRQVQCLLTGQWSIIFPSCIDSCDVMAIPDSVEIASSVSVRQIKKGQALHFQCKNRQHVPVGNVKPTCLENGQWSDPFPTCRAPVGCGAPPLLENGDSLTTQREFSNYERVQYQCQNVFVMQGGPYKTCNNGQWTGEIKCLKPCTVDSTLMDPRNIKFQHSQESKLYSPHGSGLSFACRPGKRHDGRVNLRQFCNDGVIPLPTCI